MTEEAKTYSLLHRDTWGKIENFDLYDLKDGVFRKQLTNDNNWTNLFAGQAIAEYKKFMYLAATCGKRVSPPPIIDKVWHKHLCFTDNYWNIFCPDILGKDIHHWPSAHTNKAHERDAFRLKPDHRTLYGRVWISSRVHLE